MNLKFNIKKLCYNIETVVHSQLIENYKKPRRNIIKTVKRLIIIFIKLNCEKNLIKYTGVCAYIDKSPHTTL